MKLRSLRNDLRLSPAAFRWAILAGSGLALAAAALTWATGQHAIRLMPTEIYIVVVALFFTVLGIWAGHNLTARRPAPVFVRNDAALASLGITPREYDVLVEIAGGATNKQIARTLGVSPNTIKTQAASLFAKLGAARRTDAVSKARSLSLIG